MTGDYRDETLSPNEWPVSVIGPATRGRSPARASDAAPAAPSDLRASAKDMPTRLTRFRPESGAPEWLPPLGGFDEFEPADVVIVESTYRSPERAYAAGRRRLSGRERTTQRELANGISETLLDSWATAQSLQRQTPWAPNVEG